MSAEAHIIEQTIEALFDAPSPLDSDHKPIPLDLDAEQQARIHAAATEEEIITLLQGWGYDVFRR